MIICKNLNPKDTITSLVEWEYKCPPQGKQLHWVDGRSAKETAKHWCYTIPSQFKDILKCFSLTYELCSPEYVTKFDDYKGNGRNHDLLIVAKDNSCSPFIISIESKVDEPFDKTIGDYLNAIRLRKAKGENSNADKRIVELKNAIFPNLDLSVFETIKYQLLTGIAGTFAEAKKYNTTKAIFLVQTFISSEMDSKKHRQNQIDLDSLIEVLSKDKFNIIHNGDLIGPINFKFSGQRYFPKEVDLWVGKYDVKI